MFNSILPDSVMFFRHPQSCDNSIRQKNMLWKAHEIDSVSEIVLRGGRLYLEKSMEFHGNL